MGINWKQGKQVTTIKPDQSMIVFLYKKGRKEIHQIVYGIGKITVYEKTDESKWGCIKCGKPYDIRAAFERHWKKEHPELAIKFKPKKRKDVRK